ncbi:MAG: thioredoxin [Clostridia bacterium]|nr:thioredoxin [Clostridia bacterium]MBO7288979.1 thioredoxin [Clostridia bacterium]
MSEIILTKDNFEEEVLNYNGKVLVDFWAPWCGPCKMIAPVVEEIANEFEGKIKVGKVNVDQEAELSINYQVMSIPTILIFENGKLTDKAIGYREKEELIELLNI